MPKESHQRNTSKVWNYLMSFKSFAKKNLINLFHENSVILLKIIVTFTLILIAPILFFTVNTFGLDDLDQGNNENKAKVALILGAGVNRNGDPSWVLKSRLDTGFELYKSGKVKILLVSGDNRFENYNEPKAMKEYLINQGVNPDDIVEDFAGRRTLDSCWRTKNVFKATDIYIVTQAFHMPRSEFLCKSVGLNTSIAVAPDGFRATTINGIIREIPASILAIFETIFDKSAQVKGDGTERDLSKI